MKTNAARSFVDPPQFISLINFIPTPTLCIAWIEKPFDRLFKIATLLLLIISILEILLPRYVIFQLVQSKEISPTFTNVDVNFILNTTARVSAINFNTMFRQRLFYKAGQQRVAPYLMHVLNKARKRGVAPRYIREYARREGEKWLTRIEPRNARVNTRRTRTHV